MNKATCIMVQGTSAVQAKACCAPHCAAFLHGKAAGWLLSRARTALNSFVTRDGLEMGRAQVVHSGT